MLSRFGAVTLQVPWAVRVCACILYAAVLTWLLLAPANVVTSFYPEMRGLDKVLHFCLFGLLVLLTRWAFRNPRTLTFPAMLIPLFALVYGAGTEIMQGLLVQYHRSFEWADIAANGLGAATFWFLSAALFKQQNPLINAAKPRNAALP